VGPAGQGAVRQGRPGVAGQGTAWRGKAGRGGVRLGMAGTAGRGGAGLGSARRGEATKLNQGGQKMGRERILQELNEIVKKDGTLRPESVVAFAKNPKTVLHKHFEWDDTVAAHQHRLHQARMIIRVSVMVISNDDDKKYRVFYSLKSDRSNGIGYRPMVSIFSDEDLKKQMLQDALEDMQAFKQRYIELKELSEVFEAMEKLLTKNRRIKRLPQIKYAQARA